MKPRKTLRRLAINFYSLVVTVATSVAIYIPLMAKSNLRHRDQELGLIMYDDFPHPVFVLVSYVCLLAGTAPIAVDWALDLFTYVITAGKAESVDAALLLRRSIHVALAGWPALHGALVPRRLGIMPLFCDAILQKYLSMLLFMMGLRHYDPEVWSLSGLGILTGLWTLGIFAFVSKMYFGRWMGFTVVQYGFQGVALLFQLVNTVTYFGKSTNIPAGKRTMALLFASITIIQSVLFAVLQSCFDVHISLYCEVVLEVSNYTMFCWSIIPAVLPGRVDRENVRYTNRLMEFRQAFMRYISHEIRTPLNVSTIGVAIVEDNLQCKNMLDAELKEMLDQTKQALNISTEILNDLLTFEKLNAHAMTLEQSLQRPRDFVIATASLFEIQAREKAITFILPADDPMLMDCYVVIDTYKMSQVIRNLVSNALKFTSTHGTVKIVVGIVFKENSETQSSRSQWWFSKKTAATAPEAHLGTEWVRISVVDNGAGIAPENVGKLFKQIIQFDANRLQEGKGTGLGMFISSGIVDLHGGKISAHSAGLGHGSVFAVDLPLVRISAGTLQGLDAADNPDGAANPGESLKSSQTPMTKDMTPCTTDRVGVMSGGADSVRHRSTHQPVLSTLEEVAESPAPGRTASRVNSLPYIEPELQTVPELELGIRHTPEPPSPMSRRILSSFVTSAASISNMSGFGTSRSRENENNEMGTSLRSRSNSSMSGISPRHGPNTARRRSTQSILNDIEAGKIALPSPRQLPPTQFSTIDLREYRVLLVDDSAMNLKIMSVMIKKFGADYLEARNGQEAFLLVKNSLTRSRENTPRGTGAESLTRIDMVIMDNNMDVMGGPQSCRLMREVGFTGPVFGLTGDVSEHADKEYLAAGANHIFRKPVRIQEIVKVLTERSLL
jgi:signal transduction histidine kinase/CheY-like chemotaxis protein